jgi:hypothetical protein
MKMGNRWQRRLSVLERTATAAETAMVKPLLPEWLLEIWRGHVLVSDGRVTDNSTLEATRESR